MSNATATELTIDELARETGMTVRNIRSHATRGLLPPPEVRARTGYYGSEHISRLRLIQELQANGYNLAAIKHLLGRADASSADQVLGFARSVLQPFEDEPPEIVDARELAARYGYDEIDPKVMSRAAKLGLIVPIGGDRYEIPSPTILRAGESLLEIGVSPHKALDIVEKVVRNADSVSQEFVRLFMERVWKPFARSGDLEADLPRVQETLEMLRPLATETLVAVFHLRMTGAVEKAFGRELEKRSKG